MTRQVRVTCPIGSVVEQRPFTYLTSSCEVKEDD